jgi:hypothetical protein
MNSDHFEKHNSNEHKGLGTSKVVVELAQTTLQFCNNIYGKVRINSLMADAATVLTGTTLNFKRHYLTIARPH